MTTVHLNLPDDIRAQAERRAAEAGFSNVSDYVEALVRADVVATPATDDAVRGILTQRLAAGPATPMTPADFTAIRSRLDEHISKRRARIQKRV